MSAFAINDNIINQLVLIDEKKQIFRERYIGLINNFQRRASRYGFAFHGLRSTVAVGSLLVPALLSIQYIPSTGGNGGSTTANSIALYWITWVISLLVTMSNGIYTLMKVDKKYYFLNTLVEQIRSEGWQYISLTGRYSGSSAVIGSNTHEYQFMFFCHMIEKIKMHQVEEEYFKLTDEYSKTHGQGGSNAGATSRSGGTTVGGSATGAGAAGIGSQSVMPSSSGTNLPSLIPPTPEQPLSTVMNMLPTDLREGLETALGIRPAAAVTAATSSQTNTRTATGTTGTNQV